MTDYMKEAFETWFKHQIWGNEDFKTCLSEAWQAALLAHIQRGAVPDGWQVVPKEPTKDMVEAAYDNVTGGGGRAAIYAAMLSAAPAPDHFRDAAKMMAEPAEVPMPEPDYRGPAEAGDYFSGYTHTTMCAYGDAREAAGYARGLREMLDCRTCRNYTRDGCIQTAQCVNGDGYRRAMPVRFWSAALRGEVKP